MAVEVNMENPKPAEDISAQGLLAQRALEQLRQDRSPEEQTEAARKATLSQGATEELAGGVNKPTDAIRAGAQEELQAVSSPDSEEVRGPTLRSLRKLNLLKEGRIKRPSGGELKQAVGIGLRHWAENLNPKNFVTEDWRWRLGFIGGAAESLLFTALPLPGVKGFIKAGLNLAITQGGHIALNVARGRQELKARRIYAGDQDALLARMTEIQRKYGGANQKLTRYALGMSAGAMYFSLGSLVSEVGKEALGWDMDKMFQERFRPGEGAPETATATPTETPTGAPSPTATPTPTEGAGGAPAAVRLPEHTPAVATAQPEAPPTVTPTPTAAPTPAPPPSASPLPTTSPPVTPGALESGPSLPGGLAQTGPGIGEPSPPAAAPPAGVDPGALPAAPPQGSGLAEMPSAAAQAAKETAIKAISDNPDYALAKAAEVGKVLPTVQDDIIREVLTQSNLFPSDVSTDALEKARAAIQHTLEGKANIFFDNNLDANPSAGLEGVSKVGQTSFESWLALDTTHDQLAEIAKQAMVDQAQAADAVAQNVSTALEAAPDLFTDQAIAHGTNVGQMLQDAGYQVTWTGADAPMLGAHIAANNDMLTEMWHNMAAHQNIPESPFPVGLTELNDLVAKAQAGDKEALRRLLAALRYIPAGQKFRILNKEGISAVLAALG